MKIILLTGILLIGVFLMSMNMSLTPKKIVDYKKACDGSSAIACNRLALRYYAGLGVERDDLKAIDLYKKACDGGYAIGCANLGFMNYNGIGVTQDDEKAVKFYTMACNGGDALACRNLGVIYAKNEDNIIEFNCILPSKKFVSDINITRKDWNVNMHLQEEEFYSNFNPVTLLRP